MTRPILLFILSSLTLRASQLIVENRPAYDPYRVSWSNNDHWLVSKSRRGEVRVWQTATGSMVQALPPIGAMESKLTFDASGIFAAFDRMSHAVVIDRRTGREVWKSEENAVATIGILTEKHLTYATPSELHLIDHHRNLKVAKWKSDPDTYVRNIQPLADGQIAAVMANRDTVILDGTTLALVGRITAPNNKPFYFTKTAARGSQVILCAFDGVFLADFKKPDNGFRRLARTRPVFSVAISATGDRLALVSGAEVQIRSVATDEIILSAALAAKVNDMAWSDDGSRLAIATADQGIHVIDTKTGDLVRSFGESLCFMEDAPNCAVSPNGRLIALWAEDHRLTIIDLKDMTAVVKQPVPGMTPEWMSFADARTLTAATSRTCYRFDETAGLLGKLRPKADHLGFQLAGPEMIAFRTKSEIIFHEWRDNQPVEVARHPMQIVRRHETASNGPFSLAREEEENGPLTIRMGPGWEKKAVVPPPIKDPVTLFAHPMGNALSWLDERNQLMSFSFATGKLELLKEFPEQPALRPLIGSAAPEWMVVSKPPSPTDTPDYEVISAISEKTIFRSKPWQSFRDEVDCVPVGISPSRKHLWTCGAAGHPILVDLASGQPLLRIHTWNDGGIVFETPGARFSGNDAGLARIRSVNDELNPSKPANEILAGALDTQGIRTILSQIHTDQ